MATLQDRLCLVCHQIRSPDNLGAIARLLMNFGFRNWVLSDPMTYAFREAEKMAVGAERLLESPHIVPNLKAAIGDGVYACGTTSRLPKGRTVLTPEEGVVRLREHAQRGPVCLVLGGEKRGLSDEELALCQDVVAIPTDQEQPSMNLSQATAVLLYLCSRGELSNPPTPQPEGAPLAMVHRLEEQMQTAFSKAGFLNPQAPEHVMNELLRSLTRAHLTQREAQLWLSAFTHVRRVLEPK